MLDQGKKEHDIQQWHVFYVKSRHEKKAFDELTEVGFRVYLPVTKIFKAYKSRKVWIEDPVFKGYLFVKVKRYQLYTVLQNPHLISFIKFEGEPATIREEELLLIKRMLLNKTTFQIIDGDIEVGKEISIQSGLFKGQKGKIAEIRGKSNLVITLKSLNKNIVIPINEVIPPKEENLKNQGL